MDPVQSPLKPSPSLRNSPNYRSMEGGGAGAGGGQVKMVHLNGAEKGVRGIPALSSLFQDFNEKDIDEEEVGYDDFHTIDWQRDNVRDRLRHRLIKKRKSDSFRSFCRGIFDALSAWLCVSVVGIAAGTFAGLIDIGSSWMSDLKDGVCVRAFWFDRKGCCWAEKSNNSRVLSFYEDCDEWKNWHEILGPQNFSSVTSPLVTYWVEYAMYVLVAFVFGGTSALLVRVFAPYACGSGIPEIKTILSGFIIRGYLGKWTLIIKSIGVMLAVASGLSLGKEGPFVHVACCVGNILSYAFPKYGKNEAKKREILSAASAAGVSVAFGAPIGGVLFSLEEVSYYFPMKTLWRSFFCAMTAAFVLRSMNPFNDQQAVRFYINYNKPWHFFELIPFMIIGVFGGLWGAIFNHANIWWCRFRSHSALGKYPSLEVCVVVLITALSGFHLPYTRMSGSELISLLFSDCDPRNNYTNPLCDTGGLFDPHRHAGPAGPMVLVALWHLAIALLLKCVLTVFTFGLKTPAGLFIPSMAIGAIVGRFVGIGVNELLYRYHDWGFFFAECGRLEDHNNCITAGVYALVGAAASLGGVTRMTISLVVIMFELTGRATYIIPIMMACLLSKWVGDAFGKHGIYDAHIELNEYPFLDNKKSYPNPTLSGQVMRPQPGSSDPPLVVINQEGMRVRDLKAVLLSSSYNGFPVVVSEESQYLIGYLARKDLAAALANADRNIVGSDADNALVYFTDIMPAIDTRAEGTTLRLRRIVDLAPITITDQTPMETVVEMFAKLGLRQILVTHNGRLLGIITKKDILNHIAFLRGQKSSR